MDNNNDKTPLITETESDSAANEDKTRLISLTEASESYGFNPDYLGQLARRGRLVAQKVGSMWVTTPQNVEDFIASRQKRGSFRDDIQIPD
jgi:hypothetical protein